MSQVLTRGRLALHGVTSRPTGLARNAARQTAVRLPTLQKHRTYSAPAPTTSSAAPTSNPQSTTLLSQLPDSPKLAEHLNRVFAPLQFPPELAARILTHQSHRHAVVTNNARLSFIGRRVLKTYLLLFIHSSPALKPTHDYEYILDKALNTYVLGEYVAPHWEVGQVMKWTPATSKPGSLDPAALGRDASRSVGLYKVQGTVVEAVMGGVFHQFGGSVAHRLFHTRLLPHILLPGKPEGLHDAFHKDAMRICAEMGGPHCDLRAVDQSAQKSQL